MGKVRKRRIQVNSTFYQKESKVPASKIEPSIVSRICCQLQSNSTEEVLNGLLSLGTIVTVPQNATAVCQSNIIRIAAPLLSEEDLEVRNASAVALRNLSAVSPDICDNIVDQDVLTPLIVLLMEYTDNPLWKPSFDSKLECQMDIYSEVFLHGMNLIRNLCESTSVALEFLNQTNLLEAFLRYLNFKDFGLEISISVAQCLLVISENNPKSWNVLSQHASELITLVNFTDDYGQCYISALVAGLISNVPALSAAYAQPIAASMSKILGINHQMVLKDTIDKYKCQEVGLTECENLMDTIDSMEDANGNEEEVGILQDKQNKIKIAEHSVKHLVYLLGSIRVAAEVIANYFSDNDDSVETKTVEEANSLENECVDDFFFTEDESPDNKSFSLPVDLVQTMKSVNLINNLWERSKPLEDFVIQGLHEVDICLPLKVKNVRISTLLCLQNIYNSFKLDDLGSLESNYSLWMQVGEQIFKRSNDTEILEPLTSLMRSLLEHLKSNRELFRHFPESDLQLIFDGVKSCSVPEIRANWLRILGTLGCLLSEPSVKTIIKFILDICIEEENVWSLSEALDALMDMFSDNDWNQIITDLNIITVVKHLEKLFKAKARQQRRELNNRYPAVLTVVKNFENFLKYIENQSA